MPETETTRQALAITQALAVASPGEKAEARRMGPQGGAFFWRQVARLDLSRAQETPWCHFTHLVALLTPAGRTTSIHNPHRPLGAALAEAGLSEQRFARLLASRGAARAATLERAVRMVARKGAEFDVRTLAWIVLRPEKTGDLAREYYKQIDHSPTEDTHDA